MMERESRRRMRRRRKSSDETKEDVTEGYSGIQTSQASITVDIHWIALVMVALLAPNATETRICIIIGHLDS